MLCFKELLAHVFIGLESYNIGENDWSGILMQSASQNLVKSSLRSEKQPFSGVKSASTRMNICAGSS